MQFVRAGSQSLLLVLLFPLLVLAQPDTLWTSEFDGGGDDYAVEILNTADGGFALASTSVLQGADFRLTRFDANGDTLWSRAYGTPEDDWCAGMVPVAAGGWLLCGFTFPPQSILPDAYLVRVDDAGDILWMRTIGDSVKEEAAHAILPLEDGGFLIAGDIIDSLSAPADIELWRLEANGDTLWTRRYAQPAVESAASICELADGNLLIGGSRRTLDMPNSDYYFMKTTPAGDTLWSRHYGAGDYDLVYKVLPAPDGSAVFGGLTASFDPDGDLCLGKIGGNGDSVWVRLYGGAEEDHGHSMAATADGGYLVCGHTTSFTDPVGDGYLVRTDGAGNTLWSYFFGRPGIYESFETVKATADGGVILAGNRILGVSNIFLVRLDQEQSTGSTPVLPEQFALKQNYPNPFNAVTEIGFELPAAAQVNLGVYNVTGQRVMTIVNKPMRAGSHSVRLDASTLASGIYVYRLEAGENVALKKMVVLK